MSIIDRKAATAAAAAVAGHDLDAGAHNNAGAKKLDRWLRIATFGDSNATVWNSTVSTLGTDIEKMYVPFPGTGNAAPSMPPNVATIATLTPCLHVADGGIWGQTTTQMIARGTSAYTLNRRSIQDVIRKRPDVIELNCGSINDVSTMTAATTQATIDALISRHRQIAEAFTAAGIPVIDSGIYGYSVAGVNLAAQLAIILQVNAAWKALSAANPLWHFVDMSGITHDGTGLFIPAATVDNTHLSGLGGYMAGKAKKAVVDTLFRPGQQGEVIWDQTDSFAAGGTSAPSGITDSHNPSHTTVVSRKLEAGSYSVEFDSDGLAAFFIYLTPSAIFANASADQALALEVGPRLFDSSGNEVIGCILSFRVLLYDATNAHYVMYEFSGSGETARYDGGRIIRQLGLPGPLGTSSQVYYGVQPPAAGRYTAVFSPARLYRYTPLNTLPAS